MKHLTPATAALLLLTVPGILYAQSPQMVESVEQRQQRLDEGLRSLPSGDVEIAPFDTEEIADTGPVMLLRTAPRRRWVEGTADVQYFYTSNMFLQEEPRGNEGTDTGILVSTAQVALAPDGWELGDGLLSPRLGFRYQWYNYGLDRTDNNLNNFDFDAMTLFVDARYRFQQVWVFQAGFDWQRLLNHESSGALRDYQETYKEYSPRWMVERLFPLTDDSLFSLSYSGAYRFTVSPLQLNNPDAQDRTDHAVQLFYMHRFYERLFVQPFVRYQYTHYPDQRSVRTNELRNDQTFSTGLTVSYQFADWITARTFLTYDIRETDDPVLPDFRKLDAGLGLSLMMRF